MTVSSYSIQEFVTRTLKNQGAVVEQTGYALVEILLPQQLADSYFQGKSFLHLAFDFETAKETDGCEFVTFGSYLLDLVTRLALHTGRVVECFIPVDRLTPSPQAEQMAAQKVAFIKFRPPRLKEWYPMETLYYQLNFCAVYRYAEKREEIHPILLDMSNGRQDTQVQELLPQLAKVIPLEERQHHLPQSPVISWQEAYARAAAAASKQAEQVIARLAKDQAAQRKKELSKVTRYYENTRQELQQHLGRTKDVARRKKLESQIAATNIDQKRRENDIMEKFAVDAEIYLDSLIIYHLPKIQLIMELQQRDKIIPLEMTFNTVNKQVETPLCPSCGLPASQLLLHAGEKLHCGCKGQ